MRIALADQPRLRKGPPPLRPRWPGMSDQPIGAVVVDERCRPVEQVMGAARLRVWGDRATLRSDLPLLIGSRVQVQIGPAYAVDAASKRLDLRVVDCRRKHGRYEVIAQLTHATGATATKPVRKAA